MIDTKNLTDFQLGVVGGLLLRPDKAGEAVAKVPPEAFSVPHIRAVYEAICRLFFAGAPIDAVTVRREAGEDYDVVIEEAVARAASDVPYYCEQLLEYDRLWRIQTLGLQLAETSTVDEANALVDQLNRLMFSGGRVQEASLAELMLRVVTRIREHREHEYIPFGMRELDKRLTVERGDLVILGGYSSAGKTLLSLQFAVHMAQTLRVGYFSLETSLDKAGERAIAHLAQVPLPHIKRDQVAPDELEAMMRAGASLDERDRGLRFVHAPGMNVRDIQAVTLARRFEVIFVDYLQIVQAEGRSPYERVTATSLALHTLAQRHGVTVVALAQLARPERDRKGNVPPPSMWSFKESGQIENDADVAFLLYPFFANNYRGPRVLKISKNKEGEKGEVFLKLDGARQTFAVMPDAEMRAIIEADANAGEMLKRKAKENQELDQVRFDGLRDEDPGLPF